MNSSANPLLNSAVIIYIG